VLHKSAVTFDWPRSRKPIPVTLWMGNRGALTDVKNARPSEFWIRIGFGWGRMGILPAVTMSDPFRHVSHPVCGVFNSSRENANGRPLASTPQFGESTPTRTVVIFKSSPKINWYLAEVKRHNCIRMARSSGFTSAVGRN